MQFFKGPRPSLMWSPQSWDRRAPDPPAGGEQVSLGKSPKHPNLPKPSDTPLLAPGGLAFQCCLCACLWTVFLPTHETAAFLTPGAAASSAEPAGGPVPRTRLMHLIFPPPGPHTCAPDPRPQSWEDHAALLEQSHLLTGHPLPSPVGPESGYQHSGAGLRIRSVPQGRCLREAIPGAPGKGGLASAARPKGALLAKPAEQGVGGCWLRRDLPELLPPSGGGGVLLLPYQ